MKTVDVNKLIPLKYFINFGILSIFSNKRSNWYVHFIYKVLYITNSLVQKYQADVVRGKIKYFKFLILNMIPCGLDELKTLICFSSLCALTCFVNTVWNTEHCIGLSVHQ